MMEDGFPTIVDVNFTANMESLLDSVEEGKVKWKTVVENFYPDMIQAVEKAEKELEEVKIADEVSEEVCEECGRNMVVNTVHMESSLHARDSRIVVIQNHTMRRLV